MPSTQLNDKQAKKILMKWPTRPSWPQPSGKGSWVQGQPKQGNATGPRLSSPGAKLYTTQPDGLWVYFQGRDSCDVVVVEVCGSVQNMNDKRVRYIPASHSVILRCASDWLIEEITIVGGGRIKRWEAAGTFGKRPRRDLDIPVRYLRVLYALPNDIYRTWGTNHVPTGYEFFCPHSALNSYTSQKMQRFLRQMSLASHFYTKV